MDNVMAPHAITRSADHRYTYEGVTYPGVTSILRVLDKSDALMSWAARQTAEAAITIGPEAVANLIETVGREGAIKALTSRSSWQRDEAASLGTEVHRLADLVVRGEPTPSMTEGTRERVLGYAKWWEASGWTLRISEAMVVRPDRAAELTTLLNGVGIDFDKVTTLDGITHDVPVSKPSIGWGGTFDLLAKDADGRTVLADIKTGKGVYREAVLQLAAYGLATLVQYTDGKVYPMPRIDRYVILHVTTAGVREVEVSVGTAEHMAFLACIDLHHWTESMKGKRL